MNQVKFAHLCDFASKGEDRKINVMGIFDRALVSETNVPGLYPSLHVVARVVFDDSGAHEVRIRVRNPNGVVFTESPVFKVQTTKDQEDHTLLTSLQKMKLDSFGRYEFGILVDGVEALVLPLTIEKRV